MEEQVMGAATGVAKSCFSPLSSRYRDAYSVAAGTVRFGKLVKLYSLILAGVVTVATLYYSVSYFQYIGFYCSWFSLLPGLFVAVITVAIGYISGTFIAAQGQFMSAVLDTAVNTSPHLQDSEKASIMMPRPVLES